MRSRKAFFFIAMAGIAILTEPCIGHAAKQKKAKTPKNRVQESSTVTPVSMDLFRDGTLDKQSTLKLASTLFTNKEYKDGDEVAARLVELYPKDAFVLKKVIELYLAVQNAEKTLPLYEQLRKIDPQNAQVILNAARAYSWTGRWDTALKLLDTVVSSGDTSNAIQREYADVLYNSKQYVTASEYYQKLFEKNRQKDYAIAFVYKLSAVKELVEAKKLLDCVEKYYPKDISLLETKANLALGRGDLTEALKICEELIQRSPKNRTNQTALLIKAEIASWQKEYATSLGSYDKLIASDSNHHSDYFRIKAYREKGRVLGWIAKYGKATATYDEGVRAYPESKELKAEATAKKNYYRGAYRPALKAYREWLLIEPNEPEALFDLGQLSMQNGRWKEARETYKLLLTEMPGHRQAALAQQKNSILSSMPLLHSGAEYVKSEWKSMNVTYSGAYSSISWPYGDQFSGFMRLDHKSFRFENSTGNVSQHNITTGFEYRNIPDILFRGAYGYHVNSGKSTGAHTGFVETQSEPLNNIHLGFAFRREEVIDNAETFRRGLKRNRLQGRVTYDGYRNWNAGMDYDIANYSDANQSHTTGGDVTAHLLFGQRHLNLAYRFQNYGFSSSTPHIYWSPASFNTHSLGMEFRNYFNDELFQGVNETYYSTSYKIIAEPENNISHQIRAMLYHDWSNHFSTSIEGQYSWATKAFYEDKLLKTEIRWFF
ncbi:MAG: tetratricopeptide repeat protein [Chlorobium sp.]|nr:MAG: tetratricopeptide repeat protein [Chlorobium sp.]